MRAPIDDPAHDVLMQMTQVALQDVRPCKAFFFLASKEIKTKLYESTKMRMLGQGKTDSYFFCLFLF